MSLQYISGNISKFAPCGRPLRFFGRRAAIKNVLAARPRLLQKCERHRQENWRTALETIRNRDVQVFLEFCRGFVVFTAFCSHILMKQPLLISSSRSDEFPSPAAPQFQKQSYSVSLFRDTAFDFANTLKAFIGANYLAAPYAFYKAGWVVGIVILTSIAALTFHCCALIVRCKHTAAARINARTGEEMVSLLKRLQFPDIGREAFGQTGYVFATAALGISQAGFCIGYFIFMGITLKVRNLCDVHFLNSVSLIQALLPNVSPAALFVVPPTLLLPCIFMDSVRWRFPLHGTLLLLLISKSSLSDFSNQVRRLALVSALANASIVCGFSSVLAIVLRAFSFGAPFKAELYNSSWPFAIGYSFRFVWAVI